MYDVETGTWWSHILGQAMRGELVGTRLQPISTALMTWDAWRDAHPDTTVLNMSRARMARGSLDHSSDFYTDLSLWSYGWSVGLQRYHVRVAQLEDDRVLNVTIPGANLLAIYSPHTTEVNLYSRRVDGRDLTFISAGQDRIRDEQTSTIWSMSTGEAIEGDLEGERLEVHLGMLSYTNAWESFFPTSVRLPEE